jgi:ArsR family transcriptional regulator
MKKEEDNKSVRRAAAAFSVIADPTRCRIVHLLAEAGVKEWCVYEVAEQIGLTHSATSHQLNKMEDLQLATCRREGQTMCYQLADTDFARDIVKALRIFYK